MRLFQAVLVVSCFRTLNAQIHSAGLENLGPSIQGASSSGVQNDSSSHLFLPPSSPDCWLDTLQELYPRGDFRGNGNGQPPLDLATCVHLDTHHQQALALRLTKCHLETMSQFLASTNEDGNRDACDDLHHPNGVKKCLSNLSTAASTPYTLFFKDLHFVCTRLLQESVTNRYYQTTQDLEQVSKLAETRLQKMLQQQEEHSLFWKEEVEHVAQWFQEQTQLSANQALEFQEQMQAKQQQVLHRHKEELQSLAQLSANEKLEFQEQMQDLHDRHKEELQSLADALQTTKASIQPWAQLVDVVFQYLPMGYSVLKILASMLGTMMIIMILTPHKLLRRTRLKLFAAVCYGGLGELALLWLENQNEIELTAAERLKLSDGLKNFMMSFLLACYLVGILSFCCGWNRDPQDDEDDEDTFHDPVGQLRRENELLERLRLQNYQQHLNAMSAHQQLQQPQLAQLQARLPNANRQSNHPQPPFLISSTPPPPALIHSPESTAIASSLSVVAAPWNVPPSPWTTSHGTLPAYPSTTTSGSFYDNSSHNNDNEPVRLTETIDLPPEETNDEEESDGEEETDESRNDSVSTNRKRARSEMEKTIDGEMDHKRDLPALKKPRSGGP